jgi:myo-inositol-1(or 4)-monophosphatase
VGLGHRPDQCFRALLKDADNTAGEAGARGGPPVNEPERFDFAKNLIIEAGDLALQYFASVNELSIMSKGAQDMVSEADIAVEELIRNRLMTAYPSDGYLGEETGYEEATGDSGIWVVDPVDGTQPFLSGLRSWCVSIAYVRSNEVVLGVVNNPATGEFVHWRRRTNG